MCFLLSLLCPDMDFSCDCSCQKKHLIVGTPILNLIVALFGFMYYAEEVIFDIYIIYVVICELLNIFASYMMVDSDFCYPKWLYILTIMKIFPSIICYLMLEKNYFQDILLWLSIWLISSMFATPLYILCLLKIQEGEVDIKYLV